MELSWFSRINIEGAAPLAFC